MKTIFHAFLLFCISSVFVINLPAQTKSQNSPCSELYYVSIFGLLDVDVSDSKGGKFLRNENFAINTAKGLLSYGPTGEKLGFLTFDPSATHYIDFKFPNEPMGIEVVKGCGNANPNAAVRFRDVFLPVDSKVRLTLSPQGVSDLFYDKDADGKFESVLKPAVRISGVKAADTKPPQLIIATENRGVYVLVTITAEESSGIKEIRYSLDGTHFKVYREPFQIQYTPDQVTIYTFADNNVGVRSGLYTKISGSYAKSARRLQIYRFEISHLRFKLPEIPPPKLIKALRSYNLLPAIVFLPTRRKCDEAATEVAADKSQKIDAEKQQKRFEIYQDFLRQFPEIKSHKHRKILLQGGIAAHHAGHIPAWKLLVEK